MVPVPDAGGLGQTERQRHPTAHDERSVEERPWRDEIDERRLDEHRHGPAGQDEAGEFAHHRRPQASGDRADVA
jgi:hypothetical protein